MTVNGRFEAKKLQVALCRPPDTVTHWGAELESRACRIWAEENFQMYNEPQAQAQFLKAKRSCDSARAQSFLFVSYSSTQ